MLHFGAKAESGPGQDLTNKRKHWLLEVKVRMKSYKIAS